MAHGYIEEGYGIDGGADRDRDHREHAWRGHDDWRDRGMMFGDRSHDSASSEHNRWSDRGDYSEARRSYSANPDDHYRSWRDRHMSELDRDYADYCREREQQFHSDFDAWRRQRHASYQPLRTGMTNSGLSHDPSGMTQAAEDSAPEAVSAAPDPTADATLGTNSGRGRSRG